MKLLLTYTPSEEVIVDSANNDMNDLTFYSQVHKAYFVVEVFLVADTTSAERFTINIYANENSIMSNSEYIRCTILDIDIKEFTKLNLITITAKNTHVEGFRPVLCARQVNPFKIESPTVYFAEDLDDFFRVPNVQIQQLE